jgi:hypothetical protein
VDEAEDGSAGTVGNVDHARNARHRELPAWSMGMSHTDLTNVRLTPLAAQGMCVFHSLARPEAGRKDGFLDLRSALQGSDPRPTRGPDVTPVFTSSRSSIADQFQPSPGPEAGRNKTSQNRRLPPVWFQSSSDPKAGRNSPGRASWTRRCYSGGRAQPAPGYMAGSSIAKFQFPSDPGVGRS